jgi:pyruvate dehydrogenase E2 component (dihydrolipoamide acetyltransferase)
MLRRAFGRSSALLLGDFTPISMPALSPSMSEGTLSKWLKQPGDKIQSGDSIAMVGTDKAEVSFDHQGDEGFMAKHYVEPGTTVTVGKPICLMCEEEADVKGADSYKLKEEPAAEAPAAAAKEAVKPKEDAKKAEAEKKPAKAEEGGGSASSSDDVRGALKRSGPAAAWHGAKLSDEQLKKIKPTGKDGRYTKADVVGTAASSDSLSKASGDAPKQPKAQQTAAAATAPRTSPWTVRARPVAVVDFSANDNAAIQKVIKLSTWR